MKPPEDVNDTLDKIREIHQQIRSGMAGLPPSQARDLLDHLLNAAEPKVDELREAFPTAVKAFENYKQELQGKLTQARANLDQAKQAHAQLPPLADVSKQLVPAAPPSPAGLASQLGGEIRGRYQPAAPAAPTDPASETAWQDWSLS